VSRQQTLDAPQHRGIIVHDEHKFSLYHDSSTLRCLTYLRTRLLQLYCPTNNL
jgi:hypothetical protein